MSRSEGREERGVEATDVLARATDEVDPTEPVAAQPIETTGPRERGTEIGRYIILGQLGAGGMGVVYRAYDPGLRREVALKLLRAGSVRAGGAARLIREAQAMAQLSDPHVVPVHDAGTVEGEVFIAMELVEGRTLGQWLKVKRRGWREVVEVFLEAGRGLAAAHAADIVHRDFKPSNVLIGDDGRVRVMDFGLARAATEPSEAGTPDEPESTGRNLDQLATPITEAGVVMGTPAYMAPEHARALPTDARSDQFSFCVALFEGLYGRRPFGGATTRELTHAAMAGKIRPPPPGADVPTWLRKVVTRGLSGDSDGRWPTMHALLAAMGHDPWVDRRRWLIGGAALVAFGALAFAVDQLRVEEAVACGDEPDELASIWNPERRAALEVQFLGHDAAYAQEVWQRVARRIDDYAASWSDVRREACEATHVHHDQSPALFDLRMQCLQRRRSEFEALIEVLAEPSPRVLDEAPNLIDHLPPIDRCSDTQALTSVAAPPSDPALRDAVEALRTRLDRAKALESAGKTPDALALAAQVLEEALGVDYPPIHAEAYLRLGSLRNAGGTPAAAEEAVQQAYWIALEHRHDRIAALAALEMVYVLGASQTKYERALEWGEHTRALLGRTHLEELEADLLVNLGSVRNGMAQFTEARELYERALVLKQRDLGPDSSEVAVAANNLANVLQDEGRYDEAFARYRSSIDVWRRSLGDRHPYVAVAHYNLALGLHEQGRYEDAREHYDKALSIWQDAYGPQHPNVADALRNLGTLMYLEGNADEALPYYQQALQILEIKLGPDHLRVGTAHLNLCSGLVALEQMEDARTHCEQGLRIEEAALGPEHPDLGHALDMLAHVNDLEGDHPEALRLYQRALSIREGGLPSDHPDLVESLVGVGRVLVQLGSTGEAQPHLERALTLLSKQPARWRELSEARFAMAQALIPKAPQRERAINLANLSLEALRAHDHPMASEVEAWLAKLQ